MAGSHLPPLLLRADASTAIGAGHVMRCLALAQAWQDAGGAVHFAVAELPNGLATRLVAEGMALHRLNVVPGSREDANQVAVLASELGAGWVVEDGYHFGTDYQRTIKDSGPHLVAIDDYGHAGHYVADLVLNQNIYAEPLLYPSSEPYTQLLLGTQYVLLRREFQRWRGWQRQIPNVARKVLVTMGGGDADNVTSKVIEALQQAQVDGLEVVVVVGTNNPHLSVVQDAVQQSPHTIWIEQNVTDMPELMAWADMAVTGVGSTCWELLFMGLPSIGFVLAENQRDASTALSSEGLIKLLAKVSLGDMRNELPFVLVQYLNDYSSRLRSAQIGPQVVDGLGPNRVLRFLSVQTSQ